MEDTGNGNVALEALDLLNEEIESRDNVLVPDEYTNKIINGDCLKIMNQLPDRCVDLCITDPPWGLDLWTFREKFSEEKIQNDEKDDYMKLMDEFPSRLYRVMKNDSSIYVFCGGTKPIIPKNRQDDLHWPPWHMMKKFWDVGFTPRTLLVWDKMTPGRTYRYRGKIEFVLHMTKKQGYWEGDGEFKDDYISLPEEPEMIRYQRICGARKVHIAEKPVRLYEAFIMDSSDNGELVIDPFAGSGPVVEAARNTGRKYLAIEKDEKNIPLIQKRESQVTIFELMTHKEEPEQVEICDE